MGFKEAGLRGSLRNVSVGADVIPDSVVNQYTFSEGSGQTVGDSVGTADISTNFSNWVSDSAFTDGFYLQGNGTDNRGTANAEKDFGRENFGIKFEFILPSISTDQFLFGLRDSAFDNLLLFRSGPASNPGQIDIRYEPGGDAIDLSTDDAFDDNTRHEVVFNKIGDNPSDWDVYVDDPNNPVATTVQLDQGASFANWTNPSLDWGFYARNDGGGSFTRYGDIGLGLVEINTNTYSLSEREDFMGSSSPTETDPSTIYATTSSDTSIPKAIVQSSTDTLVDCGDGLTTIDITSPENPSVLGSVGTAAVDSGYGLVPSSSGDYVYIASLVDGFYVVDISDASNPTLETTLATDAGRKVARDGSTVFMSTNDTSDRFYSIDVSDPTNPSVISTVSDSNMSRCFEVGLIGSKALVTAKDTDTVTTIDVSDPANMVVDNVWGGLTSPYGIVVDSATNTAYITEADNQDSVASVDVSDPTNPSIIDRHSSTETTHNYGADLYNGGDTIVFAARDSENITTVDTSDPANLTQVGFIDTSGADLGPYDSVVVGDHTFSIRRGNSELYVSGTE